MHLKLCLATIVALFGLGLFASQSALAGGSGFGVSYHNKDFSVKVGYHSGHHRRHYGHGYYRGRHHGYYRPRVVYHGSSYGCYPRYRHGRYYHRRPAYRYTETHSYYYKVRRDVPVYRAHRGTARCYTPGYGY